MIVFVQEAVLDWKFSVIGEEKLYFGDVVKGSSPVWLPQFYHLPDEF